MDSGAAATFLSVPVEVRLLIYKHLLDDGGSRTIQVRNLPISRCGGLEKRLRTRYKISDHAPSLFTGLHLRQYETTYYLASPGMELHTAIMAVNRQVYRETCEVLYARRCFDFGLDVAAAAPFLWDRTPYSAALVREVALYKRRPPGPGGISDDHDWKVLCRYLAAATAAAGEEEGSRVGPAVRKLRLTVEGGQPRCPWDGPQELTAREVDLLCLVKHPSLEWLAELARVKNIEELEVVPDMHVCAPPDSSAAIIYAALSASIEQGFAEYLRRKLGVTR